MLTSFIFGVFISLVSLTTYKLTGKLLEKLSKKTVDKDYKPPSYRSPDSKGPRP